MLTQQMQYLAKSIHAYHYYNNDIQMCLVVWRNGVRRLATDPMVMRSTPATGHIRYALLVNQHKYVESTFLTVSLCM